MKKIHFGQDKGSIWIATITLSFSCILGGGLELFPFENPKINGWITAMGYLLQTIYLSKMFWFKNYVQWSTSSPYVRINSRSGKTLTFKDIKETHLTNHKLIITKNNGQQETFDVKGLP